MKRLLCLPLTACALIATMGVAHAATHKKHSPVLIPAMRPIAVDYDVYVGGVHFITANVLFHEQGRTYHATVKAQTYGFWYDTIPWTTSLDVTGAMLRDRFVPSDYVVHDVWGKKPKATLLHFQKDGDIVATFDPPSYDKNRETVSRDQRIGAVDPVSALLQMLAHVSLADNCNVTVPVFDGKRRFDVIGSDGGRDEIDEEEYSDYKGSARMCNVDFRMLSGEWQDKHTAHFWDHDNKDGSREPFHIWMASLASGVPELPVRLESGSVWGLIVVHLSHWHYATSDEIKP